MKEYSYEAQIKRFHNLRDWSEGGKISVSAVSFFKTSKTERLERKVADPLLKGDFTEEILDKIVREEKEKFFSERKRQRGRNLKQKNYDTPIDFSGIKKYMR